MSFVARLKQVLLWPLKVAANVIGAGLAMAVGTALLIAIIIGTGLALSGNSFFTQEPPEADYRFISGNEQSPNRLLKMSISGIILGTEPVPRWFLGNNPIATSGYSFAESLRQITERNDISGLFLHVRTPGGTINGSMAIHRAISHFREQTDKPVVVWIEGAGLSGGMMATANASLITADLGSVVGSIGILGPSYYYYDRPTSLGSLLGFVETENGIQKEILHSGTGKTASDPFTRLGQEEKRLLQQWMDQEYQRFIAHMSAFRPISEHTLTQELGARIVGNHTGLEFGLIDQIAPRRAALEKLAELAGLKPDDWKLVSQSMPIGLTDILAELRGSSQSMSASRQQLCSWLSQAKALALDSEYLCTARP